METAFLLILTTFIGLTEEYETVAEGHYPTLEACQAAGEELVEERAGELSGTDAGGAVWFHCAEATGRSAVSPAADRERACARACAPLERPHAQSARHSLP
jgi:hypothetical protein